MLPSRGIARSLPSAGLRRQIPTRTQPPSALQRLGNGRQFGTSMRPSNGLRTGYSPLIRKHMAAPIVLGGVSTSRSLSLWGWGSKSTPVQEPTATASEAAIDVAQSVKSTAETAASTAAQAVQSTAEAATDAVAATELDLSAITDIVNNNSDILNMPEDLGYLHAIGLDYGYGPTSVMQWALEHVHVWGGLGWAASIVTTAVLLRTIMFYPQIRSLRFNAIMGEMRKDPRSKEAMKLVQQGFQNGNVEMRQKGQILNKKLREEYGTSNTGILWSLMQIPFTFGLFRIVSGMTHIPVPSLESAGWLWFTDLTVTDPYYILPAVGTALMIGALTVNAKYTPASQRKMLKNMSYIFGTVGFIGTTFLSSAVNLMTCALGAATLITAIILNNPSVRRALDLPIVSTDPKPAAPKPTAVSYEAPRPIKERLSGSLDEMKKGFSEQITNYTGQYSGTDAEKAEKKRKDMIRKLETMRKQQEQEEFEKKYKGGR